MPVKVFDLVPAASPPVAPQAPMPPASRPVAPRILSIEDEEIIPLAPIDEGDQGEGVDQGDDLYQGDSAPPAPYANPNAKRTEAPRPDSTPSPTIQWLNYLGVLFFFFGFVDLIGSMVELDVWADWFGVELPAIIRDEIAWVEIVIGIVLIKLGFDSRIIH